MRFDIQKADLWKRISAFVFDFIIAASVAVGLTAALSAIFGYSGYMDTVNENKAFIEEKYKAVDPAFDINISAEKRAKLTEEQNALYEAADKEFREIPDVIYAYNMMFNLSLIIINVSLILTFVILELAVPIFLKEGRTFGKKIFGLAVMRTNGVRMKGQALFIRSMIGKCVIETMIPVYVIIMVLFGTMGVTGIIILMLFMLLQAFVVFYSGTRSGIHDLISDTVVVDMASQMIFESEDELRAHKERIHS